VRAIQKEPVKQRTKPQSHVAETFSQVAPKLRKNTSVPLRLPTFVRGLEDESKLYAVIKSADAAGYVVVLGATPDCQGQHVCSYGIFIGTSRPLDLIGEYDFSDRHGTRVALAHGIKGAFYETDCGAYCSDALITWSEGNFHYVIGIKAEKKSDLIRTANSAILAQPS
jgi:hypothetical protein